MVALTVVAALVCGLLVACVGCKKSKEPTEGPSSDVSAEAKANMAKGYEMMQKQQQEKQGKSAGQ